MYPSYPRKFFKLNASDALIFVICSLVYWANGTLHGAPDDLSNTLLAFNLFENHTIHLDIFRDTYYAASHTMVESQNGHLTSSYPIGVAIVTLPIYGLFYLFIQITHTLSGLPLDLMGGEFQPFRLLCAKLASITLASSSVVLFYKISRLRFSSQVTAISSFLFAFATTTWTISSQALWQHGACNFALLLGLFLLLKGEAELDRGSPNSVPSLIISGFFLGLLPVIRPTSLLFLAAIGVYALYSLKKHVVFLLIGSLSICLGLAWNLYYFGNLLSGSYSVAHRGIILYDFSLQTFIDTFLAITLSPSRGLFAFSPILMLAVLGISPLWRERLDDFAKLTACLVLAGGGIFISYCFFRIWWAGHSFGPRFLTDLLVVFCLLLNYAIRDCWYRLSKSRRKLFFLMAGILASYSVFVQFVGAFGVNGAAFWNIVPNNIDTYPQRAWSLKDNQISRYTNATWHRFYPPFRDKSAYTNGLEARFLSVEVGEQLINSNSPNSETVIINSEIGSIPIKVHLENRGRSTWYGSQAALSIGEVRVRTRIIDANEDFSLWEGRMYIYEDSEPGEAATADGVLLIPQSAGGPYRLQLSLLSEGLVEIPTPEPDNRLTIPLEIIPNA